MPAKEAFRCFRGFRCFRDSVGGPWNRDFVEIVAFVLFGGYRETVISLKSLISCFSGGTVKPLKSLKPLVSFAVIPSFYRLSLRWARGGGRAETSRRCQWQKQPACFWRSAPVFPSRLWPAPGKWAKHKRSFDSPFVLSRLAAFCGAPRRALAKTGAQRQPRLRCFIHWMRSARLPSGLPTLPQRPGRSPGPKSGRSLRASG